MTTVPKRLAIKFNFKDEPGIKPKAIVPVFQRWIQEHAVEGMLIDVVDYKHVENGPGIILIADEGDYGYDLGDGQVGIKYTRKRALSDNLQDALRLVFRLGLVAAQRLEDEDILDGATFDYASAQISFIDRQHYPNTPEAFEAIQDDIRTVLSEIYGADATVSRTNEDKRDVLTIDFQVAGDVDVSRIKGRIRHAEPV